MYHQLKRNENFGVRNSNVYDEFGKSILNCTRYHKIYFNLIHNFVDYLNLNPFILEKIETLDYNYMKVFPLHEYLV